VVNVNTLVPHEQARTMKNRRGFGCLATRDVNFLQRLSGETKPFPAKNQTL